MVNAASDALRDELQQLETALRALHAAFELERPESVEAAAAG